MLLFFFYFVFLGDQILKEDRESILKHEKVHVDQKHSLDLIFFEVLRVLFWYNPLVYMYQNRIADLHEFIADAEASKTNNVKYYENLLSQIFGVNQVSFVNPFFKESLIKKLIIMLQKSKSKQVHLMKYALLIPMVVGMLIYTSCADEKADVQLEEVIEVPITDSDVLITKIKAIKTQLQIQGDVSENENKGLGLLLKTIQSDALDTKLINDVQTYVNMDSKSDLEQKIAAVFEQIQVQGVISDLEQKELKKTIAFN